MIRWWRDLSVSKKLYGVVGIMALLIASELFTLLFAMEILSAVRSFVHGEGLWSKAQKNAVHSLHRYAETRDPKYFAEFNSFLKIPLGDRAARLELEKPKYNFAVVKAGFVQGDIHPDDVKGLVKLIRRFYWVEPIEKALTIWREADILMTKLTAAAEGLDESIRNRRASDADVERALAEVDRMNGELTVLEVEFSDVLGAGSRWLEGILMYVLIFAVLTVESTGLGLTIAFSRNLNRSLRELSQTAEGVGRGNFNLRVPVRSRDELGQLAESINKMSEDLGHSTTQRDLAQNASQVKTQFLANMSHEIRTPLNVILGLTEILKDSHLSWHDHRRYIDTIERTGQNLTRIINDILDISKVEAGHLEIQSTRFSLEDFMNELYAMLNVQAGRTENVLEFRAKGEIPKMVTADRTRLRQILVNLVNNALKFTRDGRVTLTFSASGRVLTFDVEDTGRGIGREDRERLFKAFERASQTSKEEGTGLGLMLSKKLAQALGGDVSLLRTEEGRGSTFRATVECASVEAEKTAVAAAPSDKPSHGNVLEGRKVLVVEDSEDNQLLVKLFLSRQGMTDVDFAANGQEGVDQALSGDYDFVLMDMQMPVKDGYQATKELRDNGYKRPIIALTAHAMKEDRDRCMRAGCSDYLTKPIESKALFSTMARHLEA
jgi:signal transduction histidine kinase